MSRLHADALFQHIWHDTQDLLPLEVLDAPSKFQFGWVGADAKQVSAVRLLYSLRKKLADAVSPHAEDKALSKFKAVNDACGTWSLKEDRSLVEDTILGEVRVTLQRFWMRNHLESLCDDFGCLLDEAAMGPGASIGSVGNDFYSKLFAGPVTCTSSVLYVAYKAWCSFRPSWKQAEDLRASHFGAATLSQCSRLSFVPKDNEVSRTICVEPSLNMFYQLGLKRILERRLRSFFGIDFSTQQEINRELARRGSLDDSEEGLVTIDLSSASDSLSLGMLEFLLPRDWYLLLGRLRTPSTSLPDGNVLPLNMVSTMGNGFTFPMQTILFASVVSAVTKVLGESLRPGPQGNFGVYGDDIICTKRASRYVLRTLELLGFRVNAEKSFFEGPFRESCGADWYRGEPVRGFYLKSVDTPIDTYVAFNQLSLWSEKTGVRLASALRYLKGCAKYLPVPNWESDGSGFRVPSSEKPTERDRNGTTVYYRLEPIPRKLRFVDDGMLIPRGERTRIYNPDGALLSFLGGYITNGAISIRNDAPSYRRRRCLAPNWDQSADEASLLKWRDARPPVWSTPETASES